MKNLNIISLSFMFFLFPGLLTSAHAEDYKVGAVNAIRVLEKHPQAEVIRAVIEKEFAPRDQQLVAGQKSVKELEDRLTKDGEVMSESERAKLERDVINKKRDLKRSQDEFREDFNFRRNEELAKIQKDIIDAIQQVAKDNNYDVVLSDIAVVYASPKSDITNLVVEYLKGQGQVKETKETKETTETKESGQ